MTLYTQYLGNPFTQVSLVAADLANVNVKVRVVDEDLKKDKDF